jgi:predicted nucleic acid-binding protein
LLGDWYAAALAWRPQVALLVNETTLLPVLMPLGPAATMTARIVDEIGVVLSAHARAIVAFPAIRVDGPAMLLRAIEVYEKDRLDFADAYLVAMAGRSGVGVVASFDKAIDRADTVQQLVPPE